LPRLLPRQAQNRRAAIDYIARGTVKMDANDLDGAIADFTRAIELDRNYAASYFSRGLARRRVSDWTVQSATSRNRFQLNPIAEAYLDRGAVRKDKGDRDWRDARLHQGESN
jgi:tetratricopeptide (TPR) repeat protein